MSNRFPADDEHLHPYPGNLKHHKVSPAMERTIPEVYRAALATLESLIKDGYDHAKERQRKLLAEMMQDDANSGLYDKKKRKPLLSDERIIDMTWEYDQKDGDDPASLYERGLNDARKHYEDLITTGRLRVVEEVEWSKYCSVCDWKLEMDSAYTYCPGCGNPIKR